MANKNITSSQLRKTLLETGDDFAAGGLIDAETHRRITLRLRPEFEHASEIVVPCGEDIRAMRKNAGLSQAAFARRLLVSPSCVSQWERGVTRPTGAAVVLLNLIQKRGIDAIS